MSFLRHFRRFRNSYTPLIEVHISRGAIEHNFKAFAQEYNLAIAPVLKSNAYGHGLVEVAQIVEGLRPPMIVVDSIHEARLLRGEGIKTPLLVVGYTRPEMISRKRLKDVMFTVTSLEGLYALAEIKSDARIHIKLDTGMHRQGIMPEENDAAIEIIKKSNLRLEGICSHFADADGEGEEFTRTQITNWNKYVKKWQAACKDILYVHIAATAGSAFSHDIEANLVRLGTGLYGYPRHASQIFELKPALSMHTILTGIKSLSPGDKVGYNITFSAADNMRIATVPAGYYEGVDRRLSNTGSMLVGNVACRILGRVSMNITVIDVSQCPQAKLETPVAVFSDRSNDPNSLAQVAKLCNTTPLEILVHIPQHLRRVVV